MSSKSRRRFGAEQKAQIVRRHLARQSPGIGSGGRVLTSSQVRFIPGSSRCSIKPRRRSSDPVARAGNDVAKGR